MILKGKPVAKLLESSSDDQPAIASRAPAGRHRKYQTALTAVLAVLLLAALGTSGYLYIAYQRANQTAPAVLQRQLTTLNRLAVLPNETPQVATIKDAAKLGIPSLAAHTRNGDMLFIYSQAGRIVVYRPSDNKIVDMLAIRANAASTKPSPASQPATSATSTATPTPAKKGP